MLIGDIAPKKMDAPTAAAPVEAAGSSAWNTAGTWEEKDRTQWGKDRLEELLKGFKVTTPEGIIEVQGTPLLSCLLSSPSHVTKSQVTGVKDIEGEASISFSRGKKRYLYEYSLRLDFSALLASGTVTGSLTFPDCGYDAEGDWESELKVDRPIPSEAKDWVVQYLKSNDRGLRPAVIGRLNQWAADFKLQ
ncbi:unnamed protein product [Chrysoparadoxa australica]